jgi:hypothetical protein
MSINFDKIGTQVAVVQNGKYKNKVISISDQKSDDDISRGYNKLKFTDGTLQHTPNPESERQIIYITGPSGSGKSTYCKKYLLEYKKIFKKNPIFLFSSLIEDKTLDEEKGLDIIRIRVDTNLTEESIPIEEFKDSIVVFDDIDNIGNKKVRDSVYIILNNILEIGRHYNVSCISTNHLTTNGRETRRIFNEAHSVVFFPFAGAGKGLRYMCEAYLGLDKNDMKRIRSTNSRWCCYLKHYPNAIMTEHEIYLRYDED